MSRTTDCTPAIRAGRLAKARQFMEAADLVEMLADDAADVADAYVTMCVHAGIAAAEKTKAGYSALPVTANDYKRAGRAAHSLVDAAISG